MTAPKFEQVPSGVRRWPNGEPMLVVRPARPAVTIALANVALLHQHTDALKEAVTDGPCTFLGFLVTRDARPMAVDEDGKNATRVEPGDIFVEPGMLQAPD